MTTTVSQKTVEVTQADRDLVYKIWLECVRAKAHGRDNTADDTILSLIARHRQQAERGEVVAWMYVRGEHRVVVPLSERASHMTEHGWTETPLYAIPTPPEAV